MAEEVRQFIADGDEAATTAGRREREVEADRGETVFGQSHAAGCAQKKL